MRLRTVIANRESPLPFTWVNRFGEFQIFERVNGQQVRIGYTDTQTRAEKIVDALNLVESELARTA